MKKGLVTRWKRPLAAALGALFVLGAVSGAGSALPERVKDTLPEAVQEVLAPVTVQAADGDPSMSQGAEVLKATANTDNAQTVYYAGKPWRVIAYETTGNTAAGASGALTLFSADNLATSQFNPNKHPSDCNDYGNNPDNPSQPSILKTTVDSLFNGTGTALFSDKEQKAVAVRSLEVGEYTRSHPYSTGVSGTATSGYLWPLSTAEARSLPDMFRAANDFWWLRSPGYHDNHAAGVSNAGLVYNDGYLVSGVDGVRPAFYLNLNSVLFSSAAAGGKSSGGLGTLGKVETMGTVSGAPNEWKLTLLDDGTVIPALNDHAGFSASRTDGGGDVQAGGQITLKYDGAKTTANECVSVILKDLSGNILYYGNLANTTGGSASATNVPLTIPADVPAGSYTLGVFAEQCNGGNKTDYASAVSNIPLMVTAPPSITTGSLPNGTVGAAYTATLSASGTAPFNWTATGLPAGLSIGPSTGVISGTPTESRTFNVSVTATNTAGSDTKTFPLTIDPATAPATAPTVTTTTLPNGRAGDAYTTTLAADGTAPITWSATGLPAGLSIDPSTGTISGTPTGDGTFTVNVTVTNSAGSDTKTLTLTIAPSSAPVPTPTPKPTPAPAHSHHYEWVTLREADEHNDGEMVYRCKDCGDVLYRVPLTAYYVFNRNTAEKIRKAERGATLLIETRRWISFHKMVMQALADRPDVTLKVSFLDGEYRGNRMTFTIPAGTDALSLPNEEGYCGFLYLGGIFGLHPAEEN